MRAAFRAFVLLVLCTAAQQLAAQCTTAQQYPNSTIAMPLTGAVQQITSCTLPAEYSRVSGVAAGQTVRFTLAGNDAHITLRTPAGDLLADGAGNALEYVSTYTGDVLAHWTVGPMCGSDPGTCRTTTVQCLANCAPVDVALSLSAPSLVVPGDLISYTATTTVTGANPAAALVVTLEVPPGASAVSGSTGEGGSCSLGLDTITCAHATPLPVNGTRDTTFVVATDPMAPDGTVYAANASVSSNGNDTDPGNNTATASTTATAQADLSITLAGAPDPVVAGESITYSFEIANAGPNPAANVQVTLPLPPGTNFAIGSIAGGTCSGTGTEAVCSLAGNMPANSTRSGNLLLGVAPDTADATVLDAVATVSSDTFDPSPSNTSEIVQITVATSADIAVALDAPAQAYAGDTVTYTATVSNIGPSDAQAVSATIGTPTGSTLVSYDASSGSCDDDQGIVSCTLGAIAAVQTGTVAVVVQLGDAASAEATADAGAATPDPDTGNNAAIRAVGVLPSADLSIALAVQPSPPIAGAEATYTLDIVNGGPSEAADAEATFALPAGTELVSAVADGGGSCSGSDPVVCMWPGSTPIGTTRSAGIVVAVPSSAAGMLDAAASVASPTHDPDTGNNAADLDSSIAFGADLQIEKSDGRAHALVGAELVYSITVANAGPSNVAGAVLTDVIPASLDDAAWSCVQADSSVACPLPPDDVGNGDIAVAVDLPAGAWLRFDLAATVSGSTGTVVENTASIGVPAGIEDPALQNNAATDQTLVVPMGIHADGFEAPAPGIDVPAAKRAQQQALKP